ncbi:MAG: hypothetical protein RLP14_00475 [Owenweeksia sp.]
MPATIPTIVKELYYNGQLLKAEDFTTEQQFHIQHREFQTQAMFSPGVLSGLAVSNPSGKTIAITSGAALDDSGTQILLADRATYGQKQVLLSAATLSIDLSAQPTGTWQLTIANHFFNQATDQAINSPLIQLIASGSPITGQVLLAEIEVAASSVTVTPKAAAVLVLPSRMPPVQVSNLDASVISSGVFNPARIPDLQTLSGSLTAAQLPFLNKLDQAVFSSGIVSGLSVSVSGQNVLIHTGSALDKDYQLITLNEKATFNGQPLTAANGSFALSTTGLTATNAPWAITLQQNTTTPGSPILAFTSPPPQANSALLTLGTLQELTPAVTTTDDGRQNLTLDGSRVPLLTPRQLPNIQNLSGQLKAQQLPDIQNLNGQLKASQIPALSANQIPELQDLNGQLKVSQLPADMPQSKEYISFFVDKPVINSGSTVNLSWKSSDGVTGLSLDFLDGSTISSLTTAAKQITLNQSDYQVSPTETTTYTLTALINDSTVAQRQMVVTVYSGSTENINAYVSQLFQQGVTLSDAIPKIASKFFLTTYNLKNATTLIQALSQATYNALDCVSAVAEYYTQSDNWSFMVQLAGLINAPQPATLNGYIQKLAAPVPDLLSETNFSFSQYQADVLKSIATPVGEKYFDTNLSIYALYCFANGIYTVRSNPDGVNSWDSVVSSVVLNYYIQIKSVSAKQLPSAFPNIMTDATK